MSLIGFLVEEHQNNRNNSAVQMDGKRGVKVPGGGEWEQ